MSTKDNSIIAKKFWDELARWNLEAIDEYFADNFIGHSHDGRVFNKAVYKQMMLAMKKAFPDVNGNLLAMITEGDNMALRFTTIGTDKGGWAGQPPTGKRTTLQQAYFFTMKDGKFIECWSYYGAKSIE
jgi:predicted ester cyclase